MLRYGAVADPQFAQIDGDFQALGWTAAESAMHDMIGQ